MNTRRHHPVSAALLSLGLLSGCASVNFDQRLAQTRQDTAGFTDAPLSLAHTPAQRDAVAAQTEQQLASPLSQAQAVEMALNHSPAFQALLASSWAEASATAQRGRLPNPVFSFERVRAGDELELSRSLSFGLLDVLLWPYRQQTARHRLAEHQLKLSGEVVDRVTQVRQAWVDAVAAQQRWTYAQQVMEAAEASAELAQRMYRVGNFNKLDRARQQAFYADAGTQVANAQHQALATREALIRWLGLTPAQAQRLQLPERLPDLPESPLTPEAVGHTGGQQRLDVRLAQAQYDAAARAQGWTRASSLTDIELGLQHNTHFDNAEGTRTTGRGVEISLTLPLFDAGGLQRDQMNAQTLAAAQTLEATVRAAGSHLREQYSAYRTAYDIARHQRDEVLPLRKAISDENLLRYNGMFIGVFELLADARDQVSSVVAALGAQQQFWLADAALQASIVGRPPATGSLTLSTTPSAGRSDSAEH